MAPTVHRERSYRFFFYSREEPRMHVHVASPDGEAKYWLEPKVALAQNIGLSPRQIREVERILGEQQDEIRIAWREHFGR